MKEKLKNLIQDIKLKKTYAFVITGGLVLLLIATGVFAFSIASNDSSNLANNSPVDTNIGGSDPMVTVVGEEEFLISGNNTSNNSWPGEIISLNNLQVQPDREGTISEWYVHIGEKVRAGQVLGKLSRPPQTPDAIMALSEKSQMLSESRTDVEALRTYTAKRILQLQQLRKDTESSNKQKIDLLGSDTTENNTALLSSIASKKRMLQIILRGSIAKVFPMISNNTTVPTFKSSYNFQLKWSFGIIDSGLLNKFPEIIFGVLSDLENKNTVPEKSGLLYFDTAIKLANASVADGGTLSESDLEKIKQMLVEDQTEFVAVLGEIKDMELERVNTQRESIDTLAEIDSMITELEKELAMSEGEMKAKEIAYNTINGSISSGYGIVAPKSGVVSSIMKKPGEFVGPGMPVATVTGYGNEEVLVRIRIPNNIQKPQIGEMLSIVRPGFGTDIQKVRLVGVGSSLDTDGSYMADAVFTEETKWSAGASVRILAPVSSSAVLVNYSSVFWSEGGIPTIWAISEADRIFAKKITIGRTLGDLVEVYTGLKNGDRYITNPTPDIQEDMFLGDLIKNPTVNENGTSTPAGSGEDDMGGMIM